MNEITGHQIIDLSELVDGGFGAISRRDRLVGHADNESLADAAEVAIVNGDYLSESSSLDCTRCGDGRRPEANNGGNQVFGATPGLIKTRILAGAVSSEAPLSEVIASEVSARRDSSRQSGAHRADTHGNADACGCGECDGAQVALERYLANQEVLKPLVTGLWTALGIKERYGNFHESEYESLIAHIGDLVAGQYFVNGPAQVQAVESCVGIDRVESLQGGHEEVMWVINLVENTKFNQDAFIADFDSFDEEQKGVQAFWEDQWAIEQELVADETDPVLRRRLLAADLIRRVATAANLTNADLKIIILR